MVRSKGAKANKRLQQPSDIRKLGQSSQQLSEKRKKAATKGIDVMSRSVHYKIATTELYINMRAPAMHP